MTIWNRILHYLYGTFAQGFNGGIATVASIAGLDGVKQFVKDIPPVNAHLALGIFLGTFSWNCIFYFRAHPLPETLPEEGQLKSALASVIPPTPPKADLVGAPPPSV